MTAASIHSPLWHRVERLKPKLREGVTIERHVVRGEVWYVVRDQLSPRAYRFSPAVYFVLARMDGTRTFDQIWRQTVEQFGEDAPSQDQILQTASQLYVAHILRSDAPVDETDLAERGKAERDFFWTANLRNPMFVRIPLFDPDRFLNATVHLVRPFCGWLGGALWLCAVAWLALQLFANWSELTVDFADKVLAAHNLIPLLLVYPVLKILHEFGHAYAAKLAGVEVHEMGVMLLTLLPAPYVDASASAMIPSKWQRALVAAAGMIVELAVATLAMWVWLDAQPGPIRSIAYDALLTASVSTLIFNGNPLLRFDAYYILSDVLEIPNLGSRSSRYYLYLIQRYLFGTGEAQSPALAPGERFWFALYAPASFIYRMFTLYGIAMFIATKYIFIGTVLAVWMTASSIVWPILKGLRFILISPALSAVRVRAVVATVLSLAIAAAVLGLLPIPNATVARGLVWIPEDSRIVADASGLLRKFVVPPGSKVAAGDDLIVLEDPLNAAKKGKAVARLAEIEARLFAAQALSPFDAQLLDKQRDLARQELDNIVRQENNLVVRSPRAGTLIVPNATDLVDGFVKRGTTLGYVVVGVSPIIRASVPEDEIEYFSDHTPTISIRFDEAPWTRVDSAMLDRQVPQSSHKLPSPALSTASGGPFAPNPAAKDKDTILESIFEIDVATPPGFAVERWGQRVWVRFDHGAAPLIGRLYRSARQLFLGRFHV
jgi:putative peptide zinc metalloprotease protein